MNETIADFVGGLPKAELHLHIEGTLTPDQRRDFAIRNNITLPDDAFVSKKPIPAGTEGQSPADMAASSLAEFLRLYFLGLETLRTAEDYRDMMVAHLRNCARENIVYSEIMFDPQAHTTRGVAFEAMIEGLLEGRRIGRELGADSNLILCVQWDRSAESAMATLDAAQPYSDEIVGLGLDSTAVGRETADFKDVYHRAEDEGYRLTAHCDCDIPGAAQRIRDCIEILGAERIDHGTNSIDDPGVLELVRDLEINCTVCPTWRDGDPGPRRIRELRAMQAAGIVVTVNSDDPGYFASSTMGTMLTEIGRAGLFTEAEIAQFMVNAFEFSWAPVATRKRHMQSVHDYVAAFAGRPEALP
jgi:adenosine deaminase